MSFLEFIKKYYFVLIFVLLELIAIYITAKRNARVNAFVVNSSNAIVTFFIKIPLWVDNFLNLKKENSKLIEQNRKLYTLVQFLPTNTFQYNIYDEQSQLLKWKYYEARIVNHFVVGQNNYFTINKGSKDSIEVDMGVFSPDGIVGIVTNVSKNNAVLLSIFNKKIYLSCKLYRTNYYGIAFWEGNSINHLSIEQIPNHADLKIGDSIVTSGISTYFPENILIGTVESFYKNPNNNFYKITLKTGFKINEIKNVLVVKNLNLKEQKNLEKQVK